MSKPTSSFVKYHLQGTGLLQHLWLEEHLLAKAGNYVITSCVETPTLALGLGQKPSQVLNADAVKADGTPVVRRTTGGGAVLVNDRTWLVSVVGTFGALGEHLRGISAAAGEVAHPPIQPYPKALMDGVGQLFKPLFAPMDDTYGHWDNDFAFGDQKFGGSAARISRDRFIHHTSFLWEADTVAMERALAHPPRMPNYRRNRPHAAFVTSLRAHWPAHYGPAPADAHWREALEGLLAEAVGPFSEVIHWSDALEETLPKGRANVVDL